MPTSRGLKSYRFVAFFILLGAIVYEILSLSTAATTNIFGEIFRFSLDVQEGKDHEDDYLWYLFSSKNSSISLPEPSTAAAPATKVEEEEEYTMSAAHLPPACRALFLNSTVSSSRQRKRTRVPKKAPKFKSIDTDVRGVPPEYLYQSKIDPLEPMHMVAYSYNNKKKTNHTTTTTKTAILKRTEPPFVDSLPTSVTLVCVPDGIIADCTIAGPYNDDDTHNINKPIVLRQRKKWFPSTDQVQKFVERRPTVTDVPGMGIQLSGWTGFTWNHFSLDTLVRLALVYDAIVSNEPPWSDAKLVISGDVLGSGGSSGMHSMVKFLYDKLNVTHRLVNNNGWIIKANSTPRFEYMVLPDVAPHPMCNGALVVDPVFPRNVLRPIQTALGALQSLPKRYVVYAARGHGRRGVEKKREGEILHAVRGLLRDELNSTLQLKKWEYDGDNEATLELLRHAAVVMGPHGANLWNAALIPPGGLLMEFNTWEDEFTNDDCRTYGFSLANAAGLSYALVDTENFGYFKNNLLPHTELVVQALREFLTGEN